MSDLVTDGPSSGTYLQAKPKGAAMLTLARLLPLPDKSIAIGENPIYSGSKYWSAIKRAS